MKKGTLLIIPFVFLALSIAVPVKATPAWFAEAQMKITAFDYVGPVTGGIQFDVWFSGVAGGPNIIGGTVEGVDHLVMDEYGVGHLDVYLTITDEEGDKISAHVTGFAVSKNPRLIVFEDAQATIIDNGDYPTTGKFTTLVDATTRNEGFISALSMDPPGGIIHVKMYPTT